MSSNQVSLTGVGTCRVTALQTGDSRYAPAPAVSREFAIVVPAACSDGVDNDGDGLVDMADPGCPFTFASPENPQCDDGLDNDGNGLFDFADPKCSPEWPYWEKTPACGLGAELALVLPLLRLVASRRRRAS